MAVAIRERPLGYAERLDRRARDAVRGVIIHCTETPDLASARELGQRIHHPDSNTGNSGHFYIDRDGAIERWVPLQRVAHHCIGHNPDSVGIELVNQGRWPHWFRSDHQRFRQPYPAAQVEALIGLLQQFVPELPKAIWIAGHEHLDTGTVPASDDPGKTIRRKLDPGPQFPWRELLARVPLALRPDIRI